MLEERLSRDNGKGWDILENLARQAVLAAGVSALKYYEEVVALAEGANPSTMADHDATFSLIKSLEDELKNLSSEYKFDYRYFGEEFEKLETGKASDSEKKAIEDVLGKLSYADGRISKSYADFSSKYDKDNICILFDPLDGTNAFRLGLPLFSSALAFFIGDRPKISAIYNISENVIYSASLRGDESEADVWNIAQNKHSDLKEERKKRLVRRGNQPIQISTQITRSNEEKRKEGLEMLEKMPSKSTVYMLNGGQYSISQVAKGSLDCYINNWTYSWDVSPGEVLINAIGGKVTDINKKDIDYTKKRIGVIAAGNEKAYNELIYYKLF